MRQADEPLIENDSKANPFTPAQAAAFLNHAKVHEPRYCPYFLFLHDTGVRLGEAAALTWACVKLDACPHRSISPRGWAPVQATRRVRVSITVTAVPRLTGRCDAS